MKEIQKEEMLLYINKLKEEKPEYIDALIKKSDVGINSFLDWIRASWFKMLVSLSCSR